MEPAPPAPESCPATPGAGHLLAELARNPAEAVAVSQEQLGELYRTVAACLRALVSTSQAGHEVGSAGSESGEALQTQAKVAQHACFLLQCSSFLSMHALRLQPGASLGARGTAATASDADVAEMVERVLNTLEWAGQAGATSAAMEALHALSVLCVDTNNTQETLLTAADKIKAHKSVPIEALVAMTTHHAAEVVSLQSVSAQAVPGATARAQLLRLTRPLSAVASAASSKSSSMAKHLPVSSRLQPCSSRQEQCRTHLASIAGALRLTTALCKLVELQPLSTSALECALEGVRFVERCAFSQNLGPINGHETDGAVSH